MILLDLNVCEGATTTVVFSTDNTDGETTYAWTNTNIDIGLTTPGSGNISFEATNTSTAPITGTITVTPTYTNGSVSCQGTAENFTITVHPDPTITSQPQSITICSNTSTQLEVIAYGGIGTPELIYEWEQFNDPNWETAEGIATNYQYDTPNLTETTKYRVQITSSETLGCDPVTSAEATVHIPYITTQPLGETICEGGTHSMNVAADDDGGTATYAYQCRFRQLIVMPDF